MQQWLQSQEPLVICRYVSLFPFLMGVLEPSSPELAQQLELMQQPDMLWTPYGLRYYFCVSSSSVVMTEHNLHLNQLV